MAAAATFSSAFVPQHNGNPPFLRQEHNAAPHPLFSSANKDDVGDSYNGFFDDDFDRTARQREAFQFIFDVSEEMKPDSVHIILFNPGTDREGVHTIEFPKDSGNNMILAFESRSECDQFSASLREQQFFDPTPQEMKLVPLEDYCEQIGVKIQVVPKGMQLQPPKENVLNLGMNPNLEEEMKMLDYLFEISGSNEGEDEYQYDIGTTTTTEGGEGSWE
eukprot:CAMPEP_0197255562 /NCGR_PEP_ID=MMETSP1429-20130617/72477_1 /TAXON_ID=49237 /ORGANISM="Chaetoceros  sp., Strain UNC1202" /LENGTH=218 /DNA_ID=CAMNT_0042718885 /DNA_START=301 /DNA_END=957 /DNA_ORIENTATION=+